MQLGPNDLVMLTGAGGFFGRHIWKELLKRKCKVFGLKSKDEFDLRYDEYISDLFEECYRRYYKYPDYIIHAAGNNGGISYNKKYPFNIMLDNTKMACNIMEYAFSYKVKKILSIMTSCAYGDVGSELLEEENYYMGMPNKSIRAHGFAKRNLHGLSVAAYEQFGLKTNTVIVTNLYGPFDSFDVNRTKVVGALIKKFVDAKNNNSPTVECFGTGKPLREFMYVEDAAAALVKTLEVYEDYETPLNIGTGTDVTIKYLAETIADIVGYKGEIYWDVSKGDGQMKKLLSVKRMREYLGDIPITDLRTGLEKTIQWYMENY